jgi:homoaconitate hydratase
MIPRSTRSLELEVCLFRVLFFTVTACKTFLRAFTPDILLIHVLRLTTCPLMAMLIRNPDILVSGFNFGCGSSREQSTTSILAKKLPLVVSGSVGNTFSRNAINNALPLLEVPRLVQRLRETFSSTKVQSSQQNVKEPSQNRESLDSLTPAAQVTPNQKKKSIRTGWTLTWEVRFSKVTIQEGEGGPIWSQNVAALPQEIIAIIACGGLEKWVKREIGKS